MSFRMCLGAGDTLNLGGVRVLCVGREIRDHHDTPGTITRARPWGWRGAPGSWRGSLSGPRVGAAYPSKCMMNPSWTSTPAFIPACPLACTPVPAHPSTLHDLSLEVLGGQDQDMDGLHEACAGAQDPARQPPLSPTCGAAALPAAPVPILPAWLCPVPRPPLTSRSLPV